MYALNNRPNFVSGIVVGLCLTLVGCWSAGNKADPQDKVQVALGQTVYQQHCASCHGANLEGQENWRKRKPDGRLPAPPHDDTGHTWHHPDQMLVEIIKKGLVPPYAPDGYVSDMQAWEERLSEQEIWAVLAFIKSRWSAESLRIQLEIDQKARQNN